MGGPEAASAEFLSDPPDGSGGRGTETLYMELRQGAMPVDPLEWFAALARTGD
jgi:septal ring factor EnvC (AmiA/AmiB activator)